MFSVVVILLLIWNIVTGDSSKCSLVSKDSEYCGIRGDQTKSNGFYLGLPQFVSAVKDCALLCSRRLATERLNQDSTYGSNGLDTYCAGFEYDPTAKLCTLSGYPINNRTIQPNPSSQYTYYGNHCFHCGDICDQPYGAELFDNTGFEQKLLGPYEAESGRLVRGGYNSAHAFACARRYSCYFAQTFNKCPGKLYNVRFYYKWLESNQSDGSIYASMTFGGDDGEALIKSPKRIPAAGTPWQQGSFFIRIPIHLRGFYSSHLAWELSAATQGSVGNVLVDELSVVSMPYRPQIKSNTESVIVNGDFETGQLSPWTTIQKKRVSIVSPGISSNYALQVADDYRDVVLVQSLVTTVNTSYLFSVDLRVPQGDIYLTVLFGTPFNHVSYRPGFGRGNHSWTIPFIAYNNITRLSIKVHFYFAEKPVTLDSFTLMELQKPLM